MDRRADNATRTSNGSPIIPQSTDFSNQHTSNPSNNQSVITIQPTQINQDSIRNANYNQEVKRNLKRKSINHTTSKVNQPKKRYKKDRPPPPIPQNISSNKFTNQSFIEDESKSHETPEQQKDYSKNSEKNEIKDVLSQEDRVKLKISSIREKAEPFEDLIKTFTELCESNQHYYIEENLKRLVDELDEMYADVNDNKVLRMQRKEVYKYIFKLFDDLDAKVEENQILFSK